MTFTTLGISAQSLASELQTVKFQVDNMTCSMCPYTVKKALRKVDGVKEVKAKYEGDGEGWAEVTFDPGETDAASLIKATTDAGYPAHL
ncbi:MAG: mercuric transport protein periplasmic component [Gammaproteobacteria bacterium]|nr:mercuric transport protein periplasmic component [Gammaproteobacteria bacterium]